MKHRHKKRRSKLTANRGFYLSVNDPTRTGALRKHLRTAIVNSFIFAQNYSPTEARDDKGRWTSVESLVDISFSARLTNDQKNIIKSVLTSIPSSLMPKSVRFMPAPLGRVSHTTAGDAVMLAHDEFSPETIKHEVWHVYGNEHPELVDSLHRLSLHPTFHAATTYDSRKPGEREQSVKSEMFAMALDALMTNDFDEFFPDDVSKIKIWGRDNLQLTTNDYSPTEARDESGRWTKGISSSGQKQHVISTLLSAATAVKATAEQVANRLGKEAWDKLPPKTQAALTKTWKLSKAVEHKVMIGFHKTRELAAEVARQRGFSEKHTEKVSKILRAADLALAWTVNMPVAHAVTGSLLIAKVSSWVPVASLAYIAASTARNPFATIRAARVVMRGRATHNELTTNCPRSPIEKLFHGVEEYGDKFEALVYAALDETHNLTQAVRLAYDCVADFDADSGETDGLVDNDFNSSEHRKELNKARKEKNKEKLKEQARARAALRKQSNG